MLYFAAIDFGDFGAYAELLQKPVQKLVLFVYALRFRFAVVRKKDVAVRLFSQKSLCGKLVKPVCRRRFGDA